MGWLLWEALVRLNHYPAFILPLPGQVWGRFVASDLPMPEAHGDESYENRERLAGHVLMAARGYLTRIGEWVGRKGSLDADAAAPR